MIQKVNDRQIEKESNINRIITEEKRKKEVIMKEQLSDVSWDDDSKEESNNDSNENSNDQGNEN